jgi:putative transposase
MDDPLPNRHHPAHPPVHARHNTPILVFLTVCTKDRRPLLASDRVLAALHRAWSDAHRWTVGRYIVMPDHVHLFCAPATAPIEPVRVWTAYWKRLASCALPDLQPIWQRDCWDTQLRHGEHYDRKWEYVRLNPVRQKLASTPEHWPFQGEMNVLRW